MTRVWIAATLGLFVLVYPVQPRAAGDAYQLDAARSRVTIAVGKSGAFSFLGHTHEVSGPIERASLDIDADDLSHSHVSIVIATASLKVSGVDEPPADRPKVQATMESDEVLGVARFPRMTFESTSIAANRPAATAFDVVVAGPLTIRDVTRPVSVTVHVELAERSLTAHGRFSVKQTEFGIKPVSVGGAVAVKDRLDIAFTIAAQR